MAKTRDVEELFVRNGYHMSVQYDQINIATAPRPVLGFREQRMPMELAN